MPRHLISDVHERINEIPTVSIHTLVNQQRMERDSVSKRGKKTLLSLTLVSSVEWFRKCSVGRS